MCTVYESLYAREFVVCELRFDASVIEDGVLLFLLEAGLISGFNVTEGESEAKSSRNDYHVGIYLLQSEVCVSTIHYVTDDGCS